MMPITGTSMISIHQAVRSMSCRRRAPAASAGRKVPRPQMPDRIPTSPDIDPSRTPSTTETIQVKSTNHQYSARRARPENVTYLEKQTFTASIMFMTLSIAE